MGWTAPATPAPGDQLLASWWNAQIRDNLLALKMRTVEFGKSGTLAVTTTGGRWYLPYAITLVDMVLSVGTAPTGADLIVDVHKSGTTVFTTQGNRPTVAATEFVDTAATPDVTAVASGSYLEVLVDQIGSTIAGADATLTIRYYVT